MTNQHPITPPPELKEQWMNLPLSVEESLEVAARWGADQELEACCEWLCEWDSLAPFCSSLRTARRPKPPSLKEQALNELHDSINKCYLKKDAADTIRRALEQLDD